MRGFLAGVIVTLVLLVCGAFGVAQFGLYPIGADNPPGFLERSLAKEYEEHCAFCHGGAKAKVSPMRDKFNPPAPQLVSRVPHDPDNWIFWVTKHGVRMTGMPSWDGVMTDDEIWKVVAFIKHSDKLPPETAAEWQKLASEPGTIDEHTREQHQHAPGK